MWVKAHTALWSHVIWAAPQVYTRPGSPHVHGAAGPFSGAGGRPEHGGCCAAQHPRRHTAPSPREPLLLRDRSGGQQDSGVFWVGSQLGEMLNEHFGRASLCLGLSCCALSGKRWEPEHVCYRSSQAQWPLWNKGRWKGKPVLRQRPAAGPGRARSDPDGTTAVAAAPFPILSSRGPAVVVLHCRPGQGRSGMAGRQGPPRLDTEAVGLCSSTSPSSVRCGGFSGGAPEHGPEAGSSEQVRRPLGMTVRRSAQRKVQGKPCPSPTLQPWANRRQEGLRAGADDLGAPPRAQTRAPAWARRRGGSPWGPEKPKSPASWGGRGCRRWPSAEAGARVAGDSSLLVRPPRLGPVTPWELRV
ncbi:translation initiation factor IF-2-like [Mustela erminea]|uniref:translation initiation factor IF-2-like n=1 Tax=Mustela erminea TaxID=36723 RepID=UPI0013871017|nr:translation initiation factor IF-2-like [Mustela erminea]